MNIGKQSTLNDLSDLKTDLEAKIAAAADIKFSEVDQIQDGLIATGDVFKKRPTGSYYVAASASNLPTASHGMMLQLSSMATTDHWAGVYVSLSGGILFASGYQDQVVSSVERVMTDKNTITDANGFIKAA